MSITFRVERALVCPSKRAFVLPSTQDNARIRPQAPTTHLQQQQQLPTNAITQKKRAGANLDSRLLFVVAAENGKRGKTLALVQNPAKLNYSFSPPLLPPNFDEIVARAAVAPDCQLGSTWRKYFVLVFYLNLSVRVSDVDV